MGAVRPLRALLKEIEALPTLTRFGRVARIEGLPAEVTGAAGAVSLGGTVRLTSSSGKLIPCEVVGFRDGRALMPLGTLDGVSLGARADFDDRPAMIYPSRAWLGRVIEGALPQGMAGYPLKAPAPSAHTRSRIGGKLDLGVRTLNAFATCYAHIDAFRAQKKDERANLADGYDALAAIAGAGKGRA